MGHGCPPQRSNAVAWVPPDHHVWKPSGDKAYGVAIDPSNGQVVTRFGHRSKTQALMAVLLNEVLVGKTQAD